MQRVKEREGPLRPPQPIERTAGSGWTPRRLRAVSSRICQALDLILLGGIFLGVAILPAISHGTGTLAELFEVRVSLLTIVLAASCVSAWRILLVGLGVYSATRVRSMREYLFRLLIALNSCTGVVGLLVVWMGGSATVWNTLAIFWLLGLAAMAGSRFILIAFDRLLRPMLRRGRNLIIVGSGERARQVYEDFREHTEWDYTLLGFVDSEPKGFVPPGMILGGIDQLESILMRTVVDEVVIALPMKSHYEVVGSVIETCQMLGIQSQYFTDQFGTAVTKRRLSAGPDSGRVLLEVVTVDYRLVLKRMLDLALSSVALILLFPVLVGVALAVKLTSPGPILFRQLRFGLNKRTFSMLKFRSMGTDAEARQAAIEHLNETSGPAFKIRKDPRLTPIGSFIRRSSLDELPQLVNVLLGDMSLVGPRPLPLRDVDRFPEAWLMRRFSVKPGVTCLWQIGGRSDTDFDRWIALDLQYIDNWSLTLDLWILLKTLPAVLLSRGAA